MIPAVRPHFSVACFEQPSGGTGCSNRGWYQALDVDNARRLELAVPGVTANVVPMLPMSCSARLFLCARYRTQVLLCRGCDRGQQYCSRECSRQARRERCREAAQRYQCTPRGRQQHAERSRRWRARQAAALSSTTEALQSEDAGGVTHQGCTAPIVGASTVTMMVARYACETLAMAVQLLPPGARTTCAPGLPAPWTRPRRTTLIRADHS